jgi:hypothetical protein
MDRDLTHTLAQLNDSLAMCVPQPQEPGDEVILSADQALRASSIVRNIAAKVASKDPMSHCLHIVDNILYHASFTLTHYEAFVDDTKRIAHTLFEGASATDGLLTTSGEAHRHFSPKPAVDVGEVSTMTPRGPLPTSLPQIKHVKARERAVAGGTPRPY